VHVPRVIVVIGELKIKSGDLLHGDTHGVQSIPIDIATKVSAVASKIIEQETQISALCKCSGFSLKKLQALVSKHPV
jgi:regulator of RNase E activity RraA